MSLCKRLPPLRVAALLKNSCCPRLFSLTLRWSWRVRDSPAWRRKVPSRLEGSFQSNSSLRKCLTKPASTPSHQRQVGWSKHRRGVGAELERAQSVAFACGGHLVRHDGRLVNSLPCPPWRKAPPRTDHFQKGSLASDRTVPDFQRSPFWQVHPRPYHISIQTVALPDKRVYFETRGTPTACPCPAWALPHP